MRSQPDQMTRSGWAWLFPSGHITRSASSIRTFTQIRQKKIKHLQCEAHQTRSAVEVQHGSSPQDISPAALHPSEASPKSDKNVQASSMRSPPGYIGRWGSAWLFPSCLHREAHRTRSAVEVQYGPSLRPYHPQRFIHQRIHPNPTKTFKHLQCKAHRTRSAVEVQQGSFRQALNSKPTGLDQPLRFSMVHLISKPFLPSPTVCPGGGPGGNRSPTVTRYMAWKTALCGHQISDIIKLKCDFLPAMAPRPL